MINHLPEALVRNAWDFLGSNKDMIALRLTCKGFKEIGDKYGYIRTIHLSMSADFMNFVSIMSSFATRSLLSIKISHLTEPTLWIPCDWPRIVEFRLCKMGSVLIQPPSSKTEILRIRDTTRNKLKIDWSCFPRLKVLELHVYDADLSGLSACKHLERICLDFVHVNSQPFPTCIADLSNLSVVISNLYPDRPLHFLSKELRACLVSKHLPSNIRVLDGERKEKTLWQSKQIVQYLENTEPQEFKLLLRPGVYNYTFFTAKSSLVPKRHLVRPYVALNCGAFCHLMT